MMKFVPIVSKNANFYYFLHNFAKIKEPFHYRKWNISLWRKEISFTKKENLSFKRFNKIHFKYFPKVYIGKYFFLSQSPWVDLKKEISSKDLNVLREIFEILKKKFEVIYSKDLSNLKKWEIKLKKENRKLEENFLTKSITNKLRKFYNAVPQTKEVRAYLLLNSLKNNTSGERGRGLDGKSIMIELSRCSLNKINYILGIIWHEIIHCQFESYHLKKLLFSILKNEIKVLFASEIIARSFFPMGILGIKFFNLPTPFTLTSSKWETFPRIDSQQTKEILALSNYYLEKNKKIDLCYIKKLKRILKI